MRTQVVPRFEPSRIEAEAKMKWRGDREKVATTPATHFELDGVSITSRYDKAHEFDSMAGMVKGVDEALRPLIESIWCDSKANACYSVKLRACSAAQARAIAEQLDRDCREYDGGHNGIWLEGAAGGRLVVDPWWLEVPQ